jgi:hypothetical protein
LHRREVSFDLGNDILAAKRVPLKGVRGKGLRGKFRLVPAELEKLKGRNRKGKAKDAKKDLVRGAGSRRAAEIFEFEALTGRLERAGHHV